MFLEVRRDLGAIMQIALGKIVADEHWDAALAGDRIEGVAVGLGFWDDNLLVVDCKDIENAAHAFRVRAVGSVLEGECWHALTGGAGSRIVIFQSATGVGSKSAQTQFKAWIV